MPKRSASLLLCLVPCAVMATSAAVAQDTGTAAASHGVAAEAAPPPKPKRDKYGSPFDTLMTTRFWTDVPRARDFVTQSRPDVKTLDYEPLTGTEPDRPKPRDAANISALRAELEGDAAKNERKAHALRPASKARTKQAAPPRS